MFILGIHDSINEFLILIDLIYYSFRNLSLCFTEFLRVVHLFHASILLPPQRGGPSISELVLLRSTTQLVLGGFACLICVIIHNFRKISVSLKAALPKGCHLLFLRAPSCSNPNFLLLVPISIVGIMVR